jgi:hypothetical protein
VNTQQNAVKLRITLEDIDPAPWREIEIRLSASLKGLHDALQTAFLWEDSHLWEFKVNGQNYSADSYAEDGNGIIPARRMRLNKIVEKGIKEFTYIYDFGDYWVHHIEILSVFHVDANQKLPRFITGQYSAPPEDIGGAPGYEYFLEEILNNPDHPERENYEHIIEDHAHRIFDPKDLKQDDVNFLMNRLARTQKSKTA